MTNFKSNLNPMFRSKFSEDIFNHKYRHEGAETWSDLAKTLVDDVCGDLLTQEEIDQLTTYITEIAVKEGWFVDDVRVWGGNGGETTTCGAFNEYEVYVNGSVVDVTTDTYYSVEGLTNGTEYCFEVRALYSEGSSEPCAQQCAAPMGAFVVDPLAINFEIFLSKYLYLKNYIDN